MIYTTVDVICRKWLLDNNLPIHYYFEALNHSSTVLQILTQDTLQVVNSANLPVSNYGSVDLPDDFDDDLMVCIPAGLGLLQLPKQDWISPIRIHDTVTGDFTNYNDQNEDEDGASIFFGFSSGYNYYLNVDDWGSSTGRQFGATGGTMAGYKVLKERRQIQMTDGFAGSNIVLLYISDGQSVDNATQVDKKAVQCIKAYINWQSSPNKDNESSPQGRMFYNQKRRLRSLLNDLTKTDIMNIIRSSYTASIKF